MSAGSCSRFACVCYDARGQTAAEYLGVLLVVAAIIMALLLTGPGRRSVTSSHEIVRDISGDR